MAHRDQVTHLINNQDIHRLFSIFGLAALIVELLFMLLFIYNAVQLAENG